MYIYINMTKIISLADDAYANLKKTKRKGESFSKVIRRILKKRDLTPFAGKWKGSTDELDRILIDMKKCRNESKPREV